MLTTATRSEILALTSDPRRLRAAIIEDHAAGLLSDAEASSLRVDAACLHNTLTRDPRHRASVEHVLEVLAPAA